MPVPRRGAIAVVGTAMLLVAVGCAARTRERPEGSIAEQLSRADRLVRAGCYVCLTEAEALYRDLLAPSGRPVAAVRRKHALTLLLLAARARGLGLDPTWIESSRRALAAAPLDAMLEIFSRVVEQIPAPAVLDTPEAVEAQASHAAAVRASLEASARAALALEARTDPVAAHFLLALECPERHGMRLLTFDELPDEIRETPLVAYAAGACSAWHGELLDDVLRHEPRFAEAHYHRGAYALGGGALVTADAELTRASKTFPDALPIWLARGQVHLELQEFESALHAFDRVLTRTPEQRDALLGRTRALSGLRRFAQAERAADRLIELGTWFIGDAYYWRAWNRRHLGRLEAAAGDIDAAKAYLFDAAVPKLAGFIAYDRSLFDAALSELETARDLDSADCDVPLALGFVRVRQEEWSAAAPAFAEAAVCARHLQRALRERLADSELAALAPPRREALRARTEQDLAAIGRLEGLASLNAAVASSRLGHADDARTLAEHAKQWDEHREAAERLLEKLKP